MYCVHFLQLREFLKLFVCLFPNSSQLDSISLMNARLPLQKVVESHRWISLQALELF